MIENPKVDRIDAMNIYQVLFNNGHPLFKYQTGKIILLKFEISNLKNDPWALKKKN